VQFSTTPAKTNWSTLLVTISRSVRPKSRIPTRTDPKRFYRVLQTTAPTNSTPRPSWLPISDVTMNEGTTLSSPTAGQLIRSADQFLFSTGFRSPPQCAAQLTEWGVFSLGRHPEAQGRCRTQCLNHGCDTAFDIGSSTLSCDPGGFGVFFVVKPTACPVLAAGLAPAIGLGGTADGDNTWRPIRMFLLTR